MNGMNGKNHRMMNWLNQPGYRQSAVLAARCLHADE
jgi:hypothetical protein